MKNLSAIIIALIAVLSFNISAQTSKAGKIGIGYSGNLSSYSNELGMSIFATGDFSIEPQIGFKSIDIEDNSSTIWKLGLGFLYRLNNFVVTPYIGARVRYNMVSGGGETYGDLILSAVFGGEYFVSEWFSVGAEMKLNYVKTDEDYSPTYQIANSTIFESEQVLNIRLYF
jgi:hypothetical protein